MARPKRHLIGMIVVSLIGFSSVGTITVFSAGTLSLAALFVFAVILTSIPMLYLLSNDITAIRNKGVNWGSSRFIIYILAVIFPSYIVTPLYWYVSHRKITSSKTN